MALVKIYEDINREFEIEKLNDRIIQLEKQLATFQNSKNKNNGVLVHNNGTNHLVFPNQIRYMVSESNYSHIYLDSGEKIFTSKTLKYWVSKFDCEKIIRIHRGIAINESQIYRINKLDKTIQLFDGTILPYSRKLTLKNYFL